MTTNSGHVIAIVVKVTGSTPTQGFPNRIPLLNWRSHNTGLTKPSYAEINKILAIHPNTRITYSGKLHPFDFYRVITAFRRFHNV